MIEQGKQTTGRRFPARLYLLGGLLVFGLPLLGYGVTWLYAQKKTVARAFVEPAQRLKGHRKDIFAVALSPDGRYCVSGGRENAIRVWDAGTGQLLRTLEGHTDWIKELVFLPDGKRCLSASDDGAVRLWDVGTGECLHVFADNAGQVFSVAVSPDGQQALSGGTDGVLRLWDLKTGECVKKLTGHTGLIISLAFSPDGWRCATGSHAGWVRLLDLETGEDLRAFQGEPDSGLLAIAFSSDGQRCLAGNRNGTIHIWDAGTGRLLRKLKAHDGPVSAVAFARGGRLCALGGEGSMKAVRLWDTEAGEEVGRFFGVGFSVYSLALSPDGRRMAAGEGSNEFALPDYLLYLWRVPTALELRAWRLLGGELPEKGAEPPEDEDYDEEDEPVLIPMSG